MGSNPRTDPRTSASSSGVATCPGMGTLMARPLASTPGKIAVSASAAAWALGTPPPRQSSKV